VNEIFFERVNTFKYLGVELRTDGDIHGEIQHEQKVAIFEWKVLRKIFSTKKDRSTSLWKRRTNLKLRELFSETDIVATLKSKSILAGQDTCGEHKTG